MLPTLMFGQFNTKGYDVSTSAAYKVVDGSKYYFNEGDEVMMIKFNKKAITIQKYDIKKKRVEKNFLL